MFFFFFIAKKKQHCNEISARKTTNLGKELFFLVNKKIANAKQIKKKSSPAWLYNSHFVT